MTTPETMPPRKPAARVFVVSVAVAASSLVLASCSRHIDPIATRPSPDGAIIAASNTNTGEFAFEPQSNQIRLYPSGGSLRGGTIILTYGEDENPPVFKWTGPQSLDVQLPCGWWSDLTNHYQDPKATHIINISYEAPPATCPKQETASTGLPAPRR